MLHQKVCNVYLRTSPVADYQGHSIALVSRSQTTPLRYATRATTPLKLASHSPASHSSVTTIKTFLSPTYLNVRLHNECEATSGM